MPEYLVKQHTSPYSDTSKEDRANPRQCTVSSLDELENIDWIKPFTLREKFSKLSASPYITKENIEEFFLIAEDKGGVSRNILARITCPKKEALKFFPEFVKKELYQPSNDIIDVEAKIVEMEEKQKKTISDMTVRYLDFINKQ